MDNMQELCCECCSYEHCISVATKRHWNLHGCPNCGLVFVWPQPNINELSVLYKAEHGYFKTAEVDLSKTSPNAAKNLHNLLQDAGLNKGKVLDVGCSTGILIFHLRELGYDVSGCDINEGALTVAEANGLNVYKGTLESSIYEPMSSDVINMGDVIEHVYSPSKILNAAQRILKPKGVLIIRTPNASCSFATSTLTFAKITGFPWLHSEAPYHLFEFTPNSIRELLTRNGFEILTMKFSGKTPFFYSVGGTGFFDKLKQKLKAKGKYKFNIAIIPYLPLLTLVTALLLPFYLYSRVADRLRLTGHIMTVVARRLDTDYERNVQEKQEGHPLEMERL